MERVQLLLNSSPEQQAALEQLLRDQQDPSSLEYHRWLTPQEFGNRFGPAQPDIDEVSAWLQSQGVKVERIANGRRIIEFSGTAGQMEQLFHTEIHTFDTNGQVHIANSTDIALPNAVGAISSGVVSLHNFRARPLHHREPVRSTSSAGLTQPEYNNTIGNHYLAPYDFATIYNVLPLWNTLNIDGAGQAIAIVSRTNIDMADVTTFRSKFGLPGNHTQIVLNGVDPGIVSGDDLEADLDVEWSGAIAKNATIKLVISKDTNSSDGIDLSDQYAVDNNVAPVVSVSYGSCERSLGSFNTFYENLWQQAAAQGISVIVASGDAGSADCDDPSRTRPARSGFAVDGLASTPFNVAVGGTQFNEGGANAKYWSASNTPGTVASAIGYIPEVAWNESAYLSSGNSNNGLWSSGGGVSGIYATPSWQAAPGVPSSDPGTTNQHHRYLPDVSLAAADHDAYLVQNQGGLVLVSGTSAGAPTFAGIMAMINHYTNSRAGNPNLRLYALATQAPHVFHDVTSGDNAVPCSIGFSGCTGPDIAPGVAKMGGYPAGPGYDLVTGLGSVDVYNLALNWQSATTTFKVSQVAPHIASGGGWETIVNLLNPAATPAQVHLRLFGDDGSPLALPLSSTDGTIQTTASALDPAMAERSELVLRSAGPVNLASQNGSIEMSSDGSVSGFIIFRWTITGQEVLVPLQAANAQSYTLPFDNTGGLVTGLAISNSASQSVNVTVTILDQNGSQIVSGVVQLPARGHSSFVLTDRFPSTANHYGTIALAAPQDAQINTVGIRANASGAFTGIPVLANLSTGSGTAAHVASGGGWETIVQLVNLSASAAQAHLQFYGDGGGPLFLPLASTDGTINTTASAVDPTLGPGSSIVIRSAGDASTPVQTGSAELTSGGAITGSIIFRYTSTGQEVLVPLESSNAGVRILAFDNTNGLATGIAVTNRTNQIANVPVIIRDQTGAQIGTSSIPLPAQGHVSFVATDRFAATVNKYGTIEFDTPAGGQVSVVGIRGTPTGAFTGIPIVTP